ncbi:hypothetical protein A5772_02920 [Mycolicibacter sinensis]|uniref:Transmembrane protein n=1 Tax=Mycolicibacter sinensis (strain JDM601) TaxID=875328 RepID=A0A1A2E4T3_MYCSD|nr:DUF5631 domain-containing protein [Mycolicibacter sinensis]OBF99513.1 hypothetical protein A5771_18785 [Mycolicibacter sinensis]OBG05602.1 hypothetical protein A5772_02920 [Mycolicibacter sinensis]
MAIFGRRSARQRLRNAARESLAIPAFSAPVDCSAWVLGGLWPAELATITPETAPLADYLNADLQRIANSANEKLHAIGRSGLAGQARQTAEARVINVARAFAVLRVESTVRQLNKEALEIRTEYVSLNAAPVPVEVREQTPPAPPSPPSPPEPEQVGPPEPSRASGSRRGGRARHRLPETVTAEPPLNLAPPPPVEVAPPLPVEMAPPPPPVPEVAEVFDAVDQDPPDLPFRAGPLVIDSVEEESPTTGFPAEPVVPLAEAQEDLTAVIPAAREPAPAPPPPAQPAVTESSDQRLQRLLAFVARQEPALRWAIGTFADGRTLLVTDIADGWIPSGIELPAGVQLLEPGRRTGTATAMLGTPTESASYSPGDRLGWASDFGETDASVQPRELAPIDDLGWQLSEATHWRDGLPRIANTLAKAGSAGTGVVDAEIDLLRVHLDTMRYQLLAQYPDTDTAVVLNCMLLAATEGVATGDAVSANYHYSWFRTLSAPPAGQWDPQI